MRRSIIVVLVGLSNVLFASAARADYTESVNGDLSNNNAAPTVIPLSVGPNVITGTTGTVAGVTDLDYFTITVPAGEVMRSITETGYSGAPAGNLSFIGVETGTTFTPASTTTAAQTLGYDHFSAAQLDTNILPIMGTAAGAIQFTPPLMPGSYTFWIQEANQPTVNYQFNLLLAPAAPALPALFWIPFAAGLLFVGMWGIRARRPVV